MPYYKITVRLRAASNITEETAIVTYRHYMEWDIEKVWHLLENKCRHKWGHKLKEFNCIMYSKRSEDYQGYLKQLVKKKNIREDDDPYNKQNVSPTAGNFASGPGKYRKKPQ